jgi:hypothetical protein
MAFERASTFVVSWRAAGLQLGEGLFDWVQIGTVGGKNIRLAPAASMAFPTHFTLCDPRSFRMTTSSLSQGGDKNLLNISNECIAVDWAVEQAGRGQAVASKRADKGRGLPAAVWHHIDHALVAGPPSYSRVMFVLVHVSSTKTSWLGIRLLVSHATRSRFGDVSTVLFGRSERLFLISDQASSGSPTSDRCSPRPFGPCSATSSAP